MKLLCFLMLLSLGNTYATEVEKFSETLLKSVNKDIEENNVDSFKKKAPLRAPASVEISPADLPADEQKLDKSVKQLGSRSW